MEDGISPLGANNVLARGRGHLFPRHGPRPTRARARGQRVNQFFFPNDLFLPGFAWHTLEPVAENRPVCCAHGPRDFADVGRVQYLTVLPYSSARLHTE